MDMLLIVVIFISYCAHAAAEWQSFLFFGIPDVHLPNVPAVTAAAAAAAAAAAVAGPE